MRVASITSFVMEQKVALESSVSPEVGEVKDESNHHRAETRVHTIYIHTQKHTRTHPHTYTHTHTHTNARTRTYLYTRASTTGDMRNSCQPESVSSGRATKLDSYASPIHRATDVLRETAYQGFYVCGCGGKRSALRCVGVNRGVWV